MIHMEIACVLFSVAIFVSHVAARPTFDRFSFDDNYEDVSGNIGHSDPAPDPAPRIVEQVRYQPGYRDGEGHHGEERILRNTGPPRPLKYRIERKGTNKVTLCSKNAKCHDQVYDINQFNVRKD